MVLNSIVFSQPIIPTRITDIKPIVSVPDMPTLVSKSVQELNNLTITQVKWFTFYSFGFTLNDGQSCEVVRYAFDKSHIFDPTKKITRVECIIGS